ncbi:MAG: TrmH family RNA methyltransferase [Pirellulaceae bacterium]|nr:hypothetical protein [Planctomycetales bacterium]
MNRDFQHVRHKPPRVLERPRELMVALPPMQSNVNVSRIVRAAGCCGVTHIIACGHPKIDYKIARDGADEVRIEVHRTLPPVLQRLKTEGYCLVGLEQTTGSQLIYEYAFPQRCCLVVGHERHGITDDVLKMLDAVVEIPVYSLPYSHNAATATAIALYEFCRQYPDG